MNPAAAESGKHPEEWYHGSPHDFEHFGDPADYQDPETEEYTDRYKHWNTLVGNHFASDHNVARDFSSGEHTHSEDLPHDYEGPLGHVVHVKLHLKNPKVYDSEHDMDQEVYEHEWESGNHHDKHIAPPPEDDDEYEDWADEYGHRRHYAGDSQRKYSKTEPDPNYAYGFHPKATGWLNTHPDKEGIVQRYKDRMKRAGYDGVVYGNEYEGGGKSAIAFEPHQIEITQHHYGRQSCLSPDEAKRRIVHPDQQVLPGLEDLKRQLPKERSIDTSKPWPRTFTPSFTDNIPRYAAKGAQRYDTGRLWAPLPQECWDRYYGRHTGAQSRTAAMGDPTDWDAHYDPGMQVHRGMVVKVPYGLYDKLHDPGSTAEAAQELADRTSKRASTGMHWSADLEQARDFPTRNVAQGSTVPVILHAQVPAREGIETRPSMLKRNQVFPHEHWEREVPLRKGTGVDVFGISWKPDSKHPHADEHGWVRHDFTAPVRHTAKSWTMKYTTYGPQGYVDKEEEVEGPLYHGSRSKRLREGDLITPGRKANDWGDEGPKSQHVFFTSRPEVAADYADQAGGHVYEVEPMGEFKPDYSDGEYKTKHPLRVVRKVTPGKTAAQDMLDLFHGTSEDAAEMIRSEGLQPARESHPTLTTDRREAEEHASLTESPTVLHFRVPKSVAMNAMNPSPGDHEGHLKFAPTSRLHPSFLKTSALGEESARQHAGQQDVYAVRSGNSMVTLCRHHADAHVGNSGFADDLADQAGIGQRERSAEILGEPRKGSCAACNRDTGYQLKLLTPRWMQNAQDSRTRRRPDKPLNTRPLPTLRQSENLLITLAEWDDDDEQPEWCEECGEEHTSEEGHRECAACGERHEDYEDKDRHESTMTDWDEVHPRLNSHVHRVLPPMTLPDHVHEVVHDESRPMAERGEALLKHVEDQHGHGLGMHWSDVFGEGRGHGADKFAGVGGGDERDTQVVLHARKPDRDDIETDPDTLDEHQVYGYDMHDENEVPIQQRAPVHITGVSWRPGGYHQEWRHHNVKEPIEMTAKKLPTLKMLAHDATENEALRHCPFCGAGKIIGRADGSVECEFCHHYFTVQVQPQYPNFPQTINGVPQQIPGMPGQVEQPAGAPGMDAGGFPPDQEDPDAGGGPPWAQDGAQSLPDDTAEEKDAADEEEEEPPPFAKQSSLPLFRTTAGARLTEDDYVRHLAIRFAPDRDAMISRIREERGTR